ILRGPFGGQTVERALGVEFLIGDHAADADDEVVEAFGSRPEVADADHRVVKVGMEDRSEHAALRSAPRIAEGKIDFEDMNGALEDVAVGSDIQTAQVVSEAVNFRRHARGAGDLNQRPRGETRGERLMVQKQAAGAWRRHRSLRASVSGENAGLLPPGDAIDMVLQIDEAEKKGHNAA